MIQIKLYPSKYLRVHQPPTPTPRVIYYTSEYFLILIGTPFVSTKGSFETTRLITDEWRSTTNSNVYITFILTFFDN